FFQAEDGIRDFHVTGVQTCALPILLRGRRPERPARLAGRGAGRDGAPGRGLALHPEGGGGMTDATQHAQPTREGQHTMTEFKPRSEERRVGKECTSRWGRCEENNEE